MSKYWVELTGGAGGRCLCPSWGGWTRSFVVPSHPNGSTIPSDPVAVTLGTLWLLGAPGLFAEGGSWPWKPDVFPNAAPAGSSGET